MEDNKTTPVKTNELAVPDPVEQIVSNEASQLTDTTREQSVSKMIEQAITSPSAPPSAGVTPIALPNAVIPPIKVNSDDVSASNPVQTNSATPVSAEDADRIEKEWVEKAKHIVESTKDDPHAQNREISIFKADYMKKRFNKEIKVIES